MMRGNVEALTEVELETDSAAETSALGERLGRHLSPGDVVALVGELGTGKTCLAQGLARGLGVTGSLTSPTFILINQYPLPNGTVLYHVDAYRLSDPVAEGRDLGLEELLRGDGICLVEWGDRVSDLIPAEHLRICLEHIGENRRRIRLIAYGGRYADLLACIGREEEKGGLRTLLGL
jgi:tRNA threonylcarbamoyladenosine biosynthesis protein TsaE